MNIPEFQSIPDAIALDLDGTLFNSEGEISSRNMLALETLIDKGMPIIFATSRPARLFHHVLPDEIIKKCSWTVMNGAVAQGNHPLAGYYKIPIPEDVIRDVVEIAVKTFPDIRITVEIEGYEFGSNWAVDPDTLWGRNSATPDMVLSIEDSILRKPSKIALGGVGEKILKLVEILEDSHKDLITIVPAMMWMPMLNITNPGVSKTQAIKTLLESDGRSLENTVAFGDDYPDLDMLQSCGFGIAMDNAFPEIKAHCKYITESNDEDGVAVVLEKIALL